MYTQRFQKLIYLHLHTDCFMKLSPQPPEQIQCCTVLKMFNPCVFGQKEGEIHQFIFQQIIVCCHFITLIQGVTGLLIVMLVENSDTH